MHRFPSARPAAVVAALFLVAVPIVLAAPGVRAATAWPDGFLPCDGTAGPALFVAQRDWGAVFVTGSGPVLVLRGARQASAVRLAFAGTAGPSGVAGRGRIAETLAVSRGADPARWRRDVPVHREVVLRDVRPGVDVVLALAAGGFAWTVEARAGAAAALRPAVEGARSVAPAADGGLRVVTGAGELVLTGGTEAGRPGLVLVPGAGDAGGKPGAATVTGGITAELVWSTLLGGSAEDAASAVALAAGEEPVLVGTTWTTDFPRRLGDLEPAEIGGRDIVVTRLRAGVDGRRWRHILGSLQDDAGTALALAPDGDAVVAGWTVGWDFPASPGAYDTSYNDGDYVGDAVVFRLQAGNGDLFWSTYLGGSHDEEARAVAVAAGGRVLVTGYTTSDDFPATPGAYDETYNSDLDGNYRDPDVFVAELSWDGSALVWATHLGSTSPQTGRALAVDSAGRPVVAGTTWSRNFPVTPGAYDLSWNGQMDVFVSKLSADGSALVWSTFLGGDQQETCLGLALDAADEPVVAGETFSYDFPRTEGAFDVDYGGHRDAFVGRLSADGGTLLWCTYLGGEQYDRVSALTLDERGRAFVGGVTGSPDFPVTDPGALMASFQGGTSYTGDAFVSVLDPTGRDLAWSSFLGGGGDEEATGLCLAPGGDLLVTGWTRSVDWPVTAGVLDGTLDDLQDMFLCRIALPDLPLLAEPPPPADPGLLPHVPRAAITGLVPNPANPRAAVRFALDAAQPLRLTVHDAAGRLVAVLADGAWPAGEHVLDWDGRDRRGRAAATGTYLVRLETRSDVDARKLTLVR